MNESEIRWIVEHLFVGNKLARGGAQLDSRLHADLRNVRAPVIVFASHGDNITPPPQALNWIADVYASVQEIKALGQKIVYTVHDSVGHLGIFVSASVAVKEHKEIVSTLEVIEAMAPGLYEKEKKLARPILIGRPSVISARIEKAGLRMRLGVDVDNVNPEDDPRFRQYWEHYHQLMKRNGATPAVAKAAVRRSNTIIGSLMVSLGDADALICGLAGTYMTHLERIDSILGQRKGVTNYAAVNALMTNQGPLFITDTYVQEDPTAEQLAEIAYMTAQEVQRFGIVPKVAFLSHSSYGSSKRASARKMHLARDLFVAKHPDIECDGELHGDAALQPEIRSAYIEDSTLSGSANVLVCPNLDAANILYNVMKTTTSGGVTVGPILMGAAGTAHILTPAATVRRVLNMTALAAAQTRV